jgi:dolichyl-phosphate beta-glucosyltransferase
MCHNGAIMLSVIIPCYNEGQRIVSTLHRIHTYLSSQNHSHEIIVVDNGSTDDTRKKAESCIATIPEIRIIIHENFGKGWAVKQGMLEARGDYRLFTDADNSTDIKHVESLLQATTEGYDVVIGSRRIKGSHVAHPQKTFRRILGNIFAWAIQIIVPLGIKDTQNGFKLFSKKAAEDIFPEQHSYFWAFDIEVLALAKKNGYKIKEVPIEWMNDEESKMTIAGMVRMLIDVIMIRIRVY